ncbi:SMC-Scp complex subunit ScpB [Candidatus Margulisiibacteriota bacterium]
MKSTLVYQKMKQIIEALLFAAKEPLTEKKLHEIIGVPEDSVITVLEEMANEYTGRGIKVLKVAHGYILGTDPEYAEYIEALRNFPLETRLSHQSLETLAIIAYKQPVTKPEIERIRGVFSDGVIDTLLKKNLIEEKGRADSPGRPILYVTTTEFLKHFGLKDIASLPPAPEIGPVEDHAFEGILLEVA